MPKNLGSILTGQVSHCDQASRPWIRVGPLHDQVNKLCADSNARWANGQPRSMASGPALI